MTYIFIHKFWLFYFNYRFDFVKAIGQTLNESNLPKGTELTAKVLLGIVKQGPIYIMSKSSIVSNIFFIVCTY